MCNHSSCCYIENIINEKETVCSILKQGKMFDQLDQIMLRQKLITANVSTKLITALKSKICNPI
jgi:hypothetical protein